MEKNRVRGGGGGIGVLGRKKGNRGRAGTTRISLKISNLH